MPASPGQYVSGHYNATYGGTSIGSTEQGFRIHLRQHEVGVKDDAFGEGDADMIQAGADYEIELIAIEYGLFKTAMGVQTGGVGNTNNNVGKLLSSLSNTLILTPVALTPAATYGQTCTATVATLIGDIDWNNSYNLRKINARFRCLPDSTASNKAVSFTT